MRVMHLSVQGLRNLLAIEVDFSPHMNVLYGANGSGKTSVLEAIYYLAMGRSFRTRLNANAINNQCDHFTAFAYIQQDTQRIPIGLERYRDGGHKLRMGGETISSALKVAELMPVQLLSPDSRLLLVGGPKIRRSFLDWGTFHVEHQFIRAWQYAKRTLKQRNAAIKGNGKRELIQIWDAELVLAADKLNVFRKNYIEVLKPIVFDILDKLLGIPQGLTIGYYPGWSENMGLIETLNQHLERDIRLSYTQYGPHRADIILRIGKVPVQDILSQGQQKLLVYALHLAQGILLKRLTGKSCIYLLDDLPAELDAEKRSKVLETLMAIDAQIFITTVENIKDLNNKVATKMFHVEHGCLREA